METNSILTANILDILFDGRNKAYGAYDLRRTYEKRISSALCVTIIAILISVIAVSLRTTTNAIKSIGPDIITDIAPSDPIKEIKRQEKIIKSDPVKSVRNTSPVIVIDKQVTEPPVENSQFEDAKIDTKNIDGNIEVGITPPTEIKNSQAIEMPVTKIDNADIIFKAVEIKAKFNGSWSSYLQKEIEKNMDELTDAGESGTCIVKFVVSKDGSVSDVEAITMKGTKLAEIAVNAIRKGPKWVPAMQNGRAVNAYRQQPITFKIND